MIGTKYKRLNHCAPIYSKRLTKYSMLLNNRITLTNIVTSSVTYCYKSYFNHKIQKEANHFHIGDVCQAITQKLIRRHPELFDPDHKGPKLSWEEIKEKERQAHPHDRKGLFDSVPKAFPALLRAYRMGEKAHEVGFDWPDTAGVIAKIEEELNEVKDAIEENHQEHITEEIGDLLYAIVNLSRHLKIDPESSPVVP